MPIKNQNKIKTFEITETVLRTYRIKASTIEEAEQLFEERRDRDQYFYDEEADSTNPYEIEEVK